MKKCLLLFSGGLDSILAAKILEKQKIKVFPVCFKSFFFDCGVAKKSAKKLNLKLKIIDFSKEHLRIVKNPQFGYGKNFNPCIDCHLLMIKKAKGIIKKGKFDFLVTGEVLGERPFSQRKEILEMIEKKAGLEGLILRPLSAKLLKETIPEKEGWIKRERLFAIRGKSRKPQITLAKKFKIKEFPTPAGGCILTDSHYSEKLKTLFKKIPDFDGSDARILRKGRIFWPTFAKASAGKQRNFLIVVGRNEKESKELKKFKNREDLILEPENFPGPTVLIRGFGKRIKERIIMKAIEFLLNYSKKIPEKIIIEIK